MSNTPPPLWFRVNGKKKISPRPAGTRLHTEVSFFSYRKDIVVEWGIVDSVEVRGSEGELHPL